MVFGEEIGVCFTCTLTSSAANGEGLQPPLTPPHQPAPGLLYLIYVSDHTSALCEVTSYPLDSQAHVQSHTCPHQKDLSHLFLGKMKPSSQVGWE